MFDFKKDFHVFQALSFELNVCMVFFSVPVIYNRVLRMC